MPRVVEHPCEGCGCTESRACEGGCYWDPDFLVKGRYVCNRCAPAVAKRDGAATPLRAAPAVRLTVEATEKRVLVGGQPCRVYLGLFQGYTVALFVAQAGISVDAPPEVHAQFVKEFGLLPDASGLAFVPRHATPPPPPIPGNAGGN